MPQKPPRDAPPDGPALRSPAAGATPLGATEGRHVVAALGVLSASFLLGQGGRLVNRANPMGGPMNLDLSNPLGALLLLCGTMALPLLPRAWRRPGGLLAGMAAAIPATWNLWRYPPFLDGAGWSAWSGVPDPDSWPPDPFWTMLGLSPLACTLAFAWAPRDRMAGNRRRWTVPCLGAAATLAASWAYQAFGEASYAPALQPPRALILVLCAALMALASRCRRHPAALFAGAYAFVLLGLCLGSLWIEAAALAM